MGLPNRNTILKRLAVMMNAAEKVTGHEDGGTTTFGHLVLLVRDVNGKAADIEGLVLGDEDAGDLPSGQEKNVTERNRIRQGLKKSFKSIIVHSMPRPHPEIDGDDG